MFLRGSFSVGSEKVRYEAGLQPAEAFVRAVSWAFNPSWYETGGWPEEIYNARDGERENEHGAAGSGSIPNTRSGLQRL